MFFCRSSLIFLVVMLMATVVQASAEDCGNAAAAGCEPQPVCVEKTVCVPTWVTEKRTVTCTEYVPEQRTKTITCYKLVPETKEVTRTCTVMVPETRTKTITCTTYKPVYETKTCQYQVRVPVYRTVEQEYTCCVPRRKMVEQTYTVMVPRQETRRGVRKVCKVVKETEMRTVTRDEGHWETRTVEVPCQAARGGLLGRRLLACRGGWSRGCWDCSGSCCDDACDCVPTTTICQNVWVPKMVTREVSVPVCRTVVEEVPCTYTVTVCRPETRTRMVPVVEYETVTRTRAVRVCDYKYETRSKTYQVCKMVPQERAKQVQYTVLVPKQVTKTEQVVVCRRVPYEKEVNYTVCVPKQVRREVDVCVCKMVSKKVMVSACGCN